MDRQQFARLMVLATTPPFDRAAWEEAWRHAQRRGARADLLRLIRAEVNETGHRWNVPENLNPLMYRDVELCWDRRIARLFAADVAEHVLHIFEAVHPEDARPRHAIDVARRYALGNASREELQAAREAAYAAPTSQWEGPWAVVWAARSASWAAVARATMAYHAVGVARAAWAAWAEATLTSDPPPKRFEEKVWQLDRLAQYLLGEVTPCWEVE